MSKRLIVTIDGPSGAGKSTASKALAARLGYRYLDTGAMYRAFAFLVHSERERNGAADPEFLIGDFQVRFTRQNGETRTFIDSRDISEEIRKPYLSMLASELSALDFVRKRLTVLQREMGDRGGVVAEGRDMGTVVFPHAQAKFFLVADIEERARRRHRELIARGQTVSFHEVLADMKKRDDQDSSRRLAPLKPAADAVEIDSTGLTPDEVVDAMAAIVRKRASRASGA